jgi:hypothetical protein
VAIQLAKIKPAVKPVLFFRLINQPRPCIAALTSGTGLLLLASGIAPSGAVA